MQEQVSLQTALNAMTDQIAVLGGDGIIVATNSVWQTEPNVVADPRDLVGHHVREAFQSEHGVSSGAVDGILAGIDGVLQGQLPRFDYEYFEARASRVRWFLLNATPLADGQRGGELWSLSGTSPRRRSRRPTCWTAPTTMHSPGSPADATSCSKPRTC